MRKIYYAHSMGHYNTKQEERDIDTLQKMGFEVVNPNNKKYGDKLLKLLNKGLNYSAAFDKVFGDLVRGCDCLAFRAQMDGLIGTGVIMEIEVATTYFKPVIELPSALYKRAATIEQTKQYLKELGER